MAVNSYPYLTTVRVQVTWTVSSTATDPSAVNLRQINPTGTQTNFTYLTDNEVVKASTGVYRFDLTLNEEGIWYYRWEGTGLSANTSFDGVIECSPSSFVS